MAQKKSQEISTLARQLKQPESKVILDEMTTLSEDPQYARTAAPETKQQLQSAIQQAKEMYDRKASTNEWAEVAQTLAGAVAQFGAARSGLRSGRDMSNINTGPNIDYNARSERAFRDYSQEVRNAGDAADRDRQGWADSETTKEKSLKQAMSPQEDRLKNAQAIEAEEGRQNREDLRNDKNASREKDRIDNTNKNLEYKDLDREENTLSKQLREQETAATVAANRIVNEGVSSKDAKKNAAQYGDLLAKAGIDPDVLADIEEKSKDKGVLGTGYFRGEDKAKKAELIKEAVAQKTQEIRNALDAIRARKAELLGKSNSAGQNPAPALQSNTTPASAPETVKIQAPDGTIAEVPKDKAQKYIQKGGKIVQ